MAGERPDDRELLEQWRSGVPSAGQALLRRHFDELYGFFRNKVDGGVDDLVQRTFLGCVEGCERIEAGNFRAYMFGVARNVLVREFQQRKKHEAMHPLDTTVGDISPSVSQIVAKRQEHSLLLLGLQRVSVRHQVLIELSLYGLPHAQIAAATQESPKTIRNVLFRARDELRKAIASVDASAELREAALRDLQRALDEPTSEERRTLYDELVNGEIRKTA